MKRNEKRQVIDVDTRSKKDITQYKILHNAYEIELKSYTEWFSVIFESFSVKNVTFSFWIINKSLCAVAICCV